MRAVFFVAFIIAFLPGSGDAHAAVPKKRARHERCRFLPKNHLSIPANAKSVSPIDRTRFDAIVETIRRAYEPVFAARGLQLTVKADWESADVNAQATRDDQDNPVLEVSGGMARHPDMTADGFLLVLCHEIGHFLGGAPKNFRGNTQRRGWSSVEGQADYFAAAKCLKGIFVDETANEAAVREAPAPAPEKLAGVCETAQCRRIALAGTSAARVFARVQGTVAPPEIATPDTAVVPKTLTVHPSAQCRLDTFLAGDLCAVPYTEAFDDRNFEVGACPSTGTAATGSRPTCWFAPEAAR